MVTRHMNVALDPTRDIAIHKAIISLLRISSLGCVLSRWEIVMHDPSMYTSR